MFQHHSRPEQSLSGRECVAAHWKYIWEVITGNIAVVRKENRMTYHPMAYIPCDAQGDLKVTLYVLDDICTNAESALELCREFDDEIADARQAVKNGSMSRENFENLILSANSVYSYSYAKFNIRQFGIYKSIDHDCAERDKRNKENADTPLTCISYDDEGKYMITFDALDHCCSDEKKAYETCREFDSEIIDTRYDVNSGSMSKDKYANLILSANAVFSYSYAKFNIKRFGIYWHMDYKGSERDKWLNENIDDPWDPWIFLPEANKN